MIELSVLFHINLYFRSVLKMRLFSPSHSPLSWHIRDMGWDGREFHREYPLGRLFRLRLIMFL
ncbi:hypothetical protein MtrunA17_Chr4g0072261 [Medicago truncatula]|uniref:Uncharacterized protein n=1 Tax=Medicago truncatula TaxID=3880 RepID=A0A396IGJ4_MEDTR|nr:hypothetical protein MtrunA17_Chr4g0072261 [Medicago truncatula]